MCIVVWIVVFSINAYYGKVIYDVTGFNWHHWQWWVLFLIGSLLEIFACYIAIPFARKRDEENEAKKR